MHHTHRTRKMFVLDTNVLMHDPAAIFRFDEHDVYLPMIVIEELDNGKKGGSEVARNVRQASRFLDEIIQNLTKETLSDGLDLQRFCPDDPSQYPKKGRLFLQTEALPNKLPDLLPGNKADNSIIATVHALADRFPHHTVILVSKDINLRIKAAMLGIVAQDYFNDQVLDDLDLLYTGICVLPPDFWESHTKSIDSWKQEGRTFYRIEGPITQQWHPNQCLYLQGNPPFEAIVREIHLGTNSATIETVRDYRSANHAVWGITAKNVEQNFALNLLLDPQVDFVSLVGIAGSGKTLLAIAAGLVQTLDENRYRDILMTRVTVSVGEDIGFLPGTEEEKMAPWMGALMDNLEVLTQTDSGGDWGRNATADILRSRIQIRSLNFMRGRTFLNKYMIIDEAQNLTAKQMQTLITRAGPNTKIICLGNLAQIDTPYLTEMTSGLTNVVDRFQSWEHSGHITLTKGERSRLADFASERL